MPAKAVRTALWCYHSEVTWVTPYRIVTTVVHSRAAAALTHLMRSLRGPPYARVYDGVMEEKKNRLYHYRLLIISFDSGLCGQLLLLLPALALHTRRCGAQWRRVRVCPFDRKRFMHIWVDAFAAARVRADACGVVSKKTQRHNTRKPSWREYNNWAYLRCKILLPFAILIGATDGEAVIGHQTWRSSTFAARGLKRLIFIK